MHPKDVTIEVRGVDLLRVGLIDSRLWSDVLLVPRFNRLGEWSLSLPWEEPMTQALAAPGAGIIVTGPAGVIMSGPVEKFARKQEAGDEAGVVKFWGVDDSCVLWDAIVYPDPASAIDSQTVGWFERSGDVESLLRELVDENVGPSALPARRGTLAQALVLGTNLGRGGNRALRARFDSLGELLQTYALLGGLGFRVVQVGATLEFQVFEPADKSALLRFDVANRTLSFAEQSVSVPELTRVVVAGGGQGVDRVLLERTSADSAAAEAAWGRNREYFRDQRDTVVLAELEQSGDEELLDRGLTMVDTTVTPSDDLSARYGLDWREGDLVTVVVGAVEVQQPVVAAAIGISVDGVMVAGRLGDG
jgi:hypothetical protein